MDTLIDLQKYLVEKRFSKIFILCDENTSKFCLPILVEKVDEISDSNATLLEVSSEEKSSKNISTALDIISSLIDAEADRNSVIINLGGGMIMDLGGFVGSIFKRGINIINVPTTLLGIVDASIGGKTAINHQGIKNVIGVFNPNIKTYNDTAFLATLDKRLLMCGVAEMLKVFLISNEDLANRLLETKDFMHLDEELIFSCAKIKKDIVAKDLYDKGERRLLNFGHTFGHALESYYKGEYLHGECVAMGMYYAIRLSEKELNFPHKKSEIICHFIEINYFIPEIKWHNSEIKQYLIQDKKREDDRINFVLLEDIGKARMIKIKAESI